MAVKRVFARDVDTVAALMTDPDFIVERSLAIGEISAECETESDGDTVTIRSRRVTRHDLPGFLTRLVGETQRVTVEESWAATDTDWHGHYTVRSGAAPIEIRGEFALVPHGKGSVYEVRHSFRVPIPLIAGRIEKVLARQITATVEAELAYAAERLG